MKTNTKKSSRTVKKTPYYSYLLGNLAKGCQYCVKGEKVVLFVTGLCPRHCVYCPISDKKSQHDITFADEWETSDIKDIIKEAELCKSEGAGFTGGDPLVKLNRTVSYIKALKSHFGKKFHTHLYTSFDLANEVTLRSLFNAGLDEIRFHADIDNPSLWGRIDLAGKFSWDVGVEIPAIPNKRKQIEKLMDFFDGKIKFLNLNELEVSDAKANLLSAQGFKTKDSLSYGVKGSDELAMQLLDYAKKKKTSYSVHFCTATLKDKVQLAKRITRRAKSVKRFFDILNKDGTLTRGAIYLNYLMPSFGYAVRLAALSKQQKDFSLRKLETVRQHIIKTYNVPVKLIELDKDRFRLITNIGVVSHLGKELLKSGLKPAIVTEYPTWDALIVELEWV